MATARALLDRARRAAVRAAGQRVEIALDPATFAALERATRGRAELARVAGAPPTEAAITFEDQAARCLVGALRLRLRPVEVSGDNAEFRKLRRLVATLPRDVAGSLRARAGELGLSTSAAAAQLVAAHLRFLERLAG